MIQLKTPITTYVLEEGDKVEDVPAGTCYIIAKGGMYMKSTQDMYIAVRKIDSVPGLAEVSEFTRASYPRVPFKLVSAVTDFFLKVYQKFKSEAVVVLYYSHIKDKWYVDVPYQEVSGASAHYSSDILKLEGFVRIGSIHSHADFQAFHSGTDDHDEKTFDGFHMTIGHVNEDQRSHSARLMCGEKEMKLDLIESMSDKDYEYSKCPDHWLDNVTEKKYETAVYPPYNGGMEDFGCVGRLPVSSSPGRSVNDDWWDKRRAASSKGNFAALNEDVRDKRRKKKEKAPLNSQPNGLLMLPEEGEERFHY